MKSEEEEEEEEEEEMIPASGASKSTLYHSLLNDVFSGIIECGPHLHILHLLIIPVDFNWTRISANNRPIF